MRSRFCRFELRTTDVAGARRFYTALLGPGGADMVSLPEDAAARGAPAHWLGFIDVEDVERTASAFVERGAVRLGPTRRARDGGAFAIVRDPGGAVVALTRPGSASANPDVAWHELETNDLARARVTYGELFGWPFGDPLDLGPLGVHHPFAWQAGGESVGSMGDIAGRVGVHPHWLFHFRVGALEAALARVRAAGGNVIAPPVERAGHRSAACEDPQGAAFAVVESLPTRAAGAKGG